VLLAGASFIGIAFQSIVYVMIAIIISLRELAHRATASSPARFGFDPEAHGLSTVVGKPVASRSS
jgi:hypothetical protein